MNDNFLCDKIFLLLIEYGLFIMQNWNLFGALTFNPFLP